MAGFDSFDSHNIPLWKWVSANSLNVAFYSLIAKGQRKRKVIDALRLISHQIKTDRDIYLNDWLSEESVDSVKTSALKYLSELGTESDIDIILQEYEKKDIETNNAAIDAIISIRMRDSVSKGFSSIMDYQPALISNKILKCLKENGNLIHENDLKLGLSNKNKLIRSICFKLLLDRNLIDNELSVKLLSHDDYDIRLSCLINFSNKNYNLYKEQAKSILLFKDKDGKDNNSKYMEFLKSTLHLEDKDTLVIKRNERYVLDADALIALAKKDRKKYGPEVIKIIKDNCDLFYQDALNDFKSNDGTIPQIFKDLETNIRNRITSDCADWLFQCNNKADIFVLRDLLSRKHIAITKNITDYFSKFGEWQDIALIYNANFTPSNNSILGSESRRFSR